MVMPMGEVLQISFQGYVQGRYNDFGFLNGASPIFP